MKRFPKITTLHYMKDKALCERTKSQLGVEFICIWS
uniref:Uncharacterized protein n=1 Tax=Siphoviridae sp. ctYh54 TaxID=2826379 RepID=A0A8S5MEI0_9CAUD|nr:MAG TPA: hypothetical protein [Siphoviridae sp. ctYh54]